MVKMNNSEGMFKAYLLFLYFSYDKKDVFNGMKFDTKDWIIFGCGILTLLAGIVLTFIGIYAPPMGEISGSVLAALGEFLTFAGSALGIGSYTALQIHKIDKSQRKEE